MSEDPTRALPHGEQALALARSIQHKELEARSLSLLGLIHLRRGDFEEAMRSLEASLALYATLGDEQTAARELALPFIVIGAPLTQPLTHRTAEALNWGLLALVQLHAGQIQNSLRSGRRALALSQESKNVWSHVSSAICLAHGLLDGGEYEEALVLTQQAIALARTLPLMVNFPHLLTVLGGIYQALQQWEEARKSLEEAEAVAEQLDLDLGLFRLPALTRLCMHHAGAGEWEAASRYALKAIALRKSRDAAVVMWDFYFHYEMAALLRGRDERHAREVVHWLAARLGPYPRYRVPYLPSCELLATWDRQSEQAIGHLPGAAQVATDLGLP